MDTRRLHSFVTIAECGSFSEAARRLRIAQPALSRQVKLLESDLSAALLSRTVRGVTLTEAGERLLPYAISLLHQLEAMSDVVGGADRAVHGRVVIGIPTTASAVLSVPLLKAAKAEFPGIQIQLVESLSGFLQQWVEAGALDLSLLYDPAPNPTLKLEGLWIEELGLAGAPKAFPPDLDAVTLAELAKYPLIVPGSSHSLRRLVEGVAISRGVKLDVAFEADSLTVIKEMIEEGEYFAVLAEAAIHKEIAAGKLRSIRIVDPQVSRSVALVTSATRGQTRACEEIGRITWKLAHDLLRDGVWKGAQLHPPRSAHGASRGDTLARAS